VERSTRQLQHVISHCPVAPIHIDLDEMARDRDGLLRGLLRQVSQALQGQRSAVLYTSRGERQFHSKAERLAFGERVSELLVQLVQGLPEAIGFLISKGGITSNDTLSRGLELRAARVLGQVRPGCSVVRCPHDHPRFPDLPVVIFPGNVGGDETLSEVFSILTRGSRPGAAGERAVA